MQQRFRVFLSAVSGEFRSAREAVASDLRARGLEVKEQRDFRLEGDAPTTLRKLHDYIAGCDAVVAVVGARSGAKPPPAAAAPFAAMLPDGVAEASYTQWEVHFARHHGRRLYFYVAGADWTPDEPVPSGDDDPALQAALAHRLFKVEGLDRRPFSTVHELRAEVLREDWPDLRRAKPVHPRFRSIGGLFKGREDEMEELRCSLTRAGGGRIAITNKAQALHGLGGIGKTRLAVEYGLAHKREYAALLFVSGETPAALEGGLAALAGVLDLPEAAAAEDAVRVRAALDWLRLNKGWYLVLDNLDTPAALKRGEELLAHLAGGHTVVTSRLSNFSGLFEPLRLGVLAPEEAAAFLLERTEGRRRKAPDDAAQAEAIARDLDGLALALEQAGAFIAARRLTLAAYREEWAANRDEVLAWHGAGVTDYPSAAAVTWQTSVKQLTPEGRRMLERLAFLAPEPVPEYLLDVQIRPADAPTGKRQAGRLETRLRRALEDLTAYSLAMRDVDAPVFTVHRVVQAVTRQRLGAAARARALCEALGWVDAVFAGDPWDVRGWPRLDPLAPHAAAAVTAADEAGIAAPTGLLMSQLALLFHAKARYAEAEPLMRRALAIDEKAYGPDHPAVAVRLNNLAELLRDTNRLAEAEPLLWRALAIDEKAYGPDHPEVAVRLNNLALLLRATNRLAGAEPLIRRALAIDEAALGPDHPRVATRLNNLALLFHAKARYAEAEPLMRRALAISEAACGPDHPDVAIRLNNLVGLLWDTGRLAGAEPLMRRALAIDEAALGPDHPDVAVRLNNLAQLLGNTGRLAEAEPLLWRALAIGEAAHGPDHPDGAVCLNNLAGLLRDTGRLAEAEPLLWRALAIGEAAHGPDHPQMATYLNNLAQLLQDTNRPAEAEPLVRRHVEIFVAFTRATGHPHPHLALAFRNYQTLLTALGRNEAEIGALLAALVAPIAPMLAARQAPG